MVRTSEVRKGAPLITVGGKEIIPEARVTVAMGGDERSAAGAAITVEPMAVIERIPAGADRPEYWERRIPIRDETRFIITVFVCVGLVVALGTLLGRAICARLRSVA